MLEKVGHIKNPLTVIAIFAGIAEISGTIVLPFISPENQSIYIWFLMFFPFYLVWVFFRTLNRDHTVLYAPSDYKDENNFVNPVVRSTPTEQANKLAEEAAEFATDPSPEGTTDTGTPSESADKAADSSNQDTDSTAPLQSPKDINSDDNKVQPDTPDYENVNANHSYIARKTNNGFYTLNHRTMAEVAYYEKLAVHKVSWETGISFERNLKFKSKTTPVLFDAGATIGANFHALEVKVFKSNILTRQRITDTLKSCLKVIQDPNYSYASFTLHLVLVMPTSPNFSTKKEMESYVLALAELYPFNVRVYISSLEELQPPHLNDDPDGTDLSKPKNNQ